MSSAIGAAKERPLKGSTAHCITDIDKPDIEIGLLTSLTLTYFWHTLNVFFKKQRVIAAGSEKLQS